MLIKHNTKVQVFGTLMSLIHLSHTHPVVDKVTAYQPNQDSPFIVHRVLSHHFQFLHVIWTFFNLCNDREHGIVYTFIDLT
jgi:hypothetical protein